MKSNRDYEDRVFTVAALPQSQERVLLCLDRPTGKMVWQQTVLTAPLEGKHAENSYASSTPATDGEKVFVSNDDGVMHVVKAGPKFELVARNELGEKTYAPPAISHGQLFVRGFQNLYCIGPAAK